MRRLAIAFPALLTLALLTGCPADTTGRDAAKRDAPPPEAKTAEPAGPIVATPPAAEPAAPRAAPVIPPEPASPPAIPPEIVPPVPPTEPALVEARVDTSCHVETDCTVKDVGNCCGYFPACVNKTSPVFPEEVKAACEREGRASICGFREISACQCVEGECQAAAEGSGAVM